MSKKALISGGVFGLVAPFIGIFFGLQVSVVVGNILAWPVVGLVYLTGSPFGEWGVGLMIAAVAISIVAWAIVFALIAMMWPGKKGADSASQTPPPQRPPMPNAGM
jgi:hypothetical protein